MYLQKDLFQMTLNPTFCATMMSYVGSTAPLGGMCPGFFRNVICTGAFHFRETLLIITRLLHSLFTRTTRWKNYDPFFRQKDDAFKSSKMGVYELADHFRDFAATAEEHSKSEKPEERKVVFVRHQISES